MVRRLCLVVAAILAIVPAATAQNRSNDEQATLLLVRYTLLALDQANKSGNYAVLRDLGAPEFRNANSAARLAETFAKHRRVGLDLSAATVLEPVWRTPPSRDAQGILHLSGAYPSAQITTQFDLAFRPNGAGWQLTGLSVGFAPASATTSSIESAGLRR